MKTLNILSIGVLAAALTMTSCSDSFLEQEPQTKGDVASYYATEEHLTEGLVGAYVPIHNYDYNGVIFGQLNWADILGDDMLTGSAGVTDQEAWYNAADFKLTASKTLSQYWTVSYDGIKACNDIIGAIETNKDKISESFAQKATAELKVLRSFYYTVVWKWYGNIPVFMRPLDASETIEQSAPADAYEQIITDLESAINANVLPMRAAAGEEGHATLATAYMIYAELVMYQNDQTRFSKALDYMKAIINSNQYSLDNSFAHLWSPDGEWCDESIFEVNYTDGPLCIRSYPDGSDPYSTSLGFIGGTFQCQALGPDGGVASDPDVANNGWGTFVPRRTCLDLYAANDERRDVTLLDGEPGNPGARYQNQNLFLNKYLPRYSHVADGTGGSDQCRWNDNLRVYRYAETLLNAAELLVRTGGDATLAKSYITKVRQRAGLVSEVEPTLDNIMTERRLEFLGEGKRYWDLVRMEDVAGVTQKASALLKTEQDPVNDKGDRGRSGDWKPNKKYIPIDSKEISSAQGSLKQNDAYFN
ncbi:MAG: RagB/SusD family nutrient uptake outer membrane protein [Prevotella sp.]|nr:RagB/SusD family nutrient uptake outer membrane protein [Prevotella sp.]